ncbi:hypothetical protein BGT96224_5522 [Blumeria graminis f. sp. tritici 96224]|uniref:Bgt-5522 n=1 Tax=Blumeria graminis f. sp. tritici 96224 TaxID=1268274 RepID=A0A381L5Y2_BLUGR|nr:hypothetical protein BGT96224_5522 [Blumeria graminis f. sp. tritici 96224]
MYQLFSLASRKTYATIRLLSKKCGKDPSVSSAPVKRQKCHILLARENFSSALR